MSRTIIARVVGDERAIITYTHFLWSRGGCATCSTSIKAGAQNVFSQLDGLDKHRPRSRWRHDHCTGYRLRLLILGSRRTRRRWRHIRRARLSSVLSNVRRRSVVYGTRPPIVRPLRRKSASVRFYGDCRISSAPAYRLDISAQFTRRKRAYCVRGIHRENELRVWDGESPGERRSERRRPTREELVYAGVGRNIRGIASAPEAVVKEQTAINANNQKRNDVGRLVGRSCAQTSTR